MNVPKQGSITVLKQNVEYGFCSIIHQQYHKKLHKVEAFSVFSRTLTLSLVERFLPVTALPLKRRRIIYGFYQPGLHLMEDMTLFWIELT